MGPKCHPKRGTIEKTAGYSRSFIAEEEMRTKKNCLVEQIMNILVNFIFPGRNFVSEEKGHRGILDLVVRKADFLQP